MNVVVAYFSEMGRRGCLEDPTFLLMSMNYEFASNVHCNVFSFWEKNLYEGQRNFSILALFVVKLCMPADVSRHLKKRHRQSPRSSRSRRGSARRSFLLLDNALARNIRNLA